jgi:hypothetical protein
MAPGRRSPYHKRMSMIERHWIERKFLDGAERDVLVVKAIRHTGERIHELFAEAEALYESRFYRIEIDIPAAVQVDHNA